MNCSNFESRSISFPRLIDEYNNFVSTKALINAVDEIKSVKHLIDSLTQRVGEITKRLDLIENTIESISERLKFVEDSIELIPNSEVYVKLEEEFQKHVPPKAKS